MASEALGVQRPSSIRSVASSASAASGTSLTRRSRTRTRSRTITGGAKTPNNDPGPDLFNLGDPNSQELSLPIPSIISGGSPVRSQESLGKTTTDPIRILDEGSGQPLPDGVSIMLDRASDRLRLPSSVAKSSQTSGLPVLPTALQPEPPPSAFSRDPSLLTRVTGSGSNVRDSLSTQLSGMSSSVYPLSTSTASITDSPLSPPSIAQDEIYDPPYEVGEVQEYDNDDVSYRLQLLMKNSYFLPPAHSKPSPADFASFGTNALNAAKKPTRTTAPTFLDLLWGKTRRKSASPVPPDAPPPALRTAADSITPSPTSQPRISSQMPRVSPTPGIRTGRVVVVREKMEDLSAAAKQAETDLKIRGARREPPVLSSPSMTDIVDPTDAVDLPIPSSTYPFAVQASALHGLGVAESVGAALLADRLPPPPHSPGMSSMNEEDNWRKALLHQAVHLSLDGSHDMSAFSPLRMSPSSMMSPRISPRQRPTLDTTLTPPIGKPILDQRIINSPVLSDQSQSPLKERTSTNSFGSNSSTKGRKNERRAPGTFRSSLLPARAETPMTPPTPLAPPPRKFLINPLHSLSQAELLKTEFSQTPAQANSPSHSLRKTMSSPVLSETYEDRRHFLLTPPPLPTPNRSSFHDVSPSFDAMSQMTSDSHSSDDVAFVDRRARASLALSAINGRPSTDHSRPSPSPSPYHVMNTSHTSSHYQSTRTSADHGTAFPRYSTMSPPPRVSSSLAHPTLLPPPRGSSPRHLELRPQRSGHTHITEALTDDTTMVIIAPEPSSPPIPSFPPIPSLSERRGNTAARQLSLNIPSTNIPPAIHSAPGPSSPTSFFDSIQSQPNAMDDLESSDSEEGHDKVFHHSPGPIHPYADPNNQNNTPTTVSSRPSITRLGNHSTPHIHRTAEPLPAFPFRTQGQMQPVGNTPVRKRFFTERTSDSGHGTPTSTLDFYQYAQHHRPATAEHVGKRRSTVGSMLAWRNNEKTKESMKKLDGMLIQHMEAEKDKMRQIARTVRSNIPVDSKI